jgi:predicted CoA-substrate-specific enzyme activase
MKTKAFAALDCGAVSFHICMFDADGALRESAALAHEGRLAESFAALTSDLAAKGMELLLFTTDVPQELEALSPLPFRRLDARLALIEGAKSLCPQVRTILHVGAERFFLLRFDDQGRYLDLKSNSSCAAGTGGFLDQQARRLSLSGSDELGQRALERSGDAPRIASRCSVFAKTDLIHAQQEGYSLEQICDGLCRGLVATICDSVLVDAPEFPLLFSGGVALNKGVLRALTERLGHELVVPENPDYLPALGAGRLWLAEREAGRPLSTQKLGAAPSTQKLGADSEALADAEQLSSAPEAALHSSYPPLELRFSDYPDFAGLESYVFQPDWAAKRLVGVELERYAEFPAGKLPAYLGIDIGSTSTKAALTDAAGEMLAGFYTRTAGQPLDAVRSIFQAIEDVAARYGTEIQVLGAATTGSGRKFIGSIIGADLALDEISAHARAAVSLNPAVDTIIEIGGQDAKFTTLKNGVVTFSRMNTVCAAGTGSFVEEQSQKLGVALADYADLAMGVAAPRASDRCTVFMERDINHYLARGCTTPAILAAVLFSVRENYLLKVADLGAIGSVVCFQGATARNKALVAAFEEKLQRPILVSRYCHLTGALGCALTLMEERAAARSGSDTAQAATGFRGLDLYRKDIPLETETCELCRNHCRIRVLTVDGQKVAFGFLCGRDYETKRYVAKTAANSFSALRDEALAASSSRRSMPSLGYPYALQGVEELPLWKHFFDKLDIPLVTTESLTQAIAIGKKESGAEFCAPLTAFHGHVRSLCGKADYLFLPVYLEYKEADAPKRVRKYCYYTQYDASLAAAMLDKLPEAPGYVSPVFRDRGDNRLMKEALWSALETPWGTWLTREEVSAAWDSASEFFDRYKQQLAASFTAPAAGELAVALLGRPYTVLPPSMNKSIPQLFSALGVKTYFQDMLPDDYSPDAETEALLEQIHWRYAARILRYADFCAHTEGLYPVFITSFKCAPDSFVQEYLSRIMDKAGKPYLVLQLDEHDSNVGYETRIEAALRSFRNHRAMAAQGFAAQGFAAQGFAAEGFAAGKTLPVAPRYVPSLRGKTVLLPNWDPVAIRLLAASMRFAGYDARALEETPELVTEGLKSNTGQCIPINVIAHEFAAYIRKHQLKPSDTVLWMIKADWACNIGMYPAFIRSLLEKEGDGIAEAGVYVGDLTMIELGPMVTARAYFAYLYAGLIHRLACRIRPYEVEAGATDRVVEEALCIFEHALEGKARLRKAARKVGKLFTSIKRDESRGRRSKVAIFGDLYLRDNPVMNQDLVKAIEDAGGEVVVIAYTEYTKIVSSGVFRRWIQEQRYREFVLFRALLGALEILEGIFQDESSSIAGPTIHYEGGDFAPYLKAWHVQPEQEGETFENLLKVRRLLKTYPDIKLFVHTSPAFCCPSLVTEALAPRIEAETGVPVVNIIYDGTSAYRNDILAPYLRYPRAAKEA